MTSTALHARAPVLRTQPARSRARMCATAPYAYVTVHARALVVHTLPLPVGRVRNTVCLCTSGPCAFATGWTCTSLCARVHLCCIRVTIGRVCLYDFACVNDLYASVTARTRTSLCARVRYWSVRVRNCSCAIDPYASATDQTRTSLCVRVRFSSVRVGNCTDAYLTVCARVHKRSVRLSQG